MKAILKAFGRAFAIGIVIGAVSVPAVLIDPDAYGWLIGVCDLVFLWATCMVAAARGWPLIVQAAVAVGVSWGWTGGTIAAIAVSGTATDLSDWTGFPVVLIGLPLVILATVALVNWVSKRFRPAAILVRAVLAGASLLNRPFRWIWCKLHPDSGPKPLPGLWIICVLAGLGGMHLLTTALSMETVGMVVCGALALLHFVIAGALYLRRRWGWYLAIAAYGLGGVTACILQVLGGHPRVLAIAIYAVPALVIVLYLWLRRRQFGPDAGPGVPVLSARGVSALAVVVLLGGGYLLLMSVDDAAESFPALEAKVPVPPKDQNGYFMLQQMAKKWPLQDDQQLQDVVYKMDGAGMPPSTEWLKAAKAAVQKYQGCLAEGRELVEKPHFVEVTDLQGIARISRPMPWLETSRELAWLFAVSAEVDAADRHWGQALDEADRAIALGVMMSKESDCTIQDLVGVADMAIGMASLRRVAGVVPDVSLLKAHLGPTVPEEVLRKGHNLAAAGEFQADVGLIREISTKSSADIESQLGLESGRVVPGFLSPRHVRTNPWLKVNMTTNLFGGWIQHMIIQPGTYVAVPPMPNPISPQQNPCIIRRGLGYLRFARDPLGYILSFMMLPSAERWVGAYFATIAHGRMTQIFIALRCYQLEHGGPPDSLGALAPGYLQSIPLDPFTGKPFGYESTGKRARLWFAGPDWVAGSVVVFPTGLALTPSAKNDPSRS